MFFGLKKTTTISGYIQRLMRGKILYYVLINIVIELTFIALSYETSVQNDPEFTIYLLQLFCFILLILSVC